jgi:hypothetical protein
MKNIRFIIAIVLAIGLMNSCTKNELINPAGIAKNDGQGGGGNQKIVQNCVYSPLQQTAPNEWSGTFQGVNVKFSDLHIRNDGKLYGRMVYAENGIILVGGDSYNQRDFGAEITVCAVSSPTIEVSTSTVFGTQIQSSAFINSVLSALGIFEMLGIDDLVITQLAQLANPQQTVVKTTNYRKVTYTTCGSSRLLTGKLVAQGVTYNLVTGAYTFTGMGMATMCYTDPMVNFIS